MIKAEIIADSKNEFGNRITTMVVTFPRYILAELNTHRMFSRNSASSRAIPFEKMIKSVRENPFIPMAWMKDHKGMQGTEYFNNETCEEAFIEIDRCFGYQEFKNIPAVDYLKKQWLRAKDDAIDAAEDISELGLTKQLCNRIMEPFMWHTAIITATEWENFFALRCPQYGGYHERLGDIYFRSKKDSLKALENTGVNISNLKLDDTLGWLKVNKGQADIHMMALAEAMYDAYNESTPKQLKEGEWHIPFGEKVKSQVGYEMDGSEASDEEFIINCIKVATACCARVSYTVVGEEGKADNYENDIKLHDRLASCGHWSPFEHCAKVMGKEEFSLGNNGPLVWSGNFRGFIQYRKMFNNENITDSSK